jgi:hypothetical protein
MAAAVDAIRCFLLQENISGVNKGVSEPLCVSEPNSWIFKTWHFLAPRAPMPATSSLPGTKTCLVSKVVTAAGGASHLTD